MSDFSTPICKLVGHNSVINDLALSDSNYELYTAGFDSTIKIWDLKSYSLLYTLKCPTSRWRLVLSSGDKQIFTIGYDNDILIHENPLQR